MHASEDPARTSTSADVPKWAVPEIVARISRLTDKPASHMESLQVTHYDEGQYFARHLDAVDMHGETGHDFAFNGGNRVVAVLVYLNDVKEGGATSFTDLGFSILPVTGRAIVFFPAGSDGRTDTRLHHVELPPMRGEKWVFQAWIRQRETDFE